MTESATHRNLLASRLAAPDNWPNGDFFGTITLPTFRLFARYNDRPISFHPPSLSLTGDMTLISQPVPEFNLPAVSIENSQQVMPPRIANSANMP